MLALWLECLPRVSVRWQAPDLLPLRLLRQAIHRSVVERSQTTSRIRLSEALLPSTIQAVQCLALRQVCPRQVRSQLQVVRLPVVGLARHLRLANTALHLLKVVLPVVTVLRLLRQANTVHLHPPGNTVLRHLLGNTERLRPLGNTVLLRLKADNSVARLKVPKAANTARLKVPKAANTVVLLQAGP